MANNVLPSARRDSRAQSTVRQTIPYDRRAHTECPASQELRCADGYQVGRARPVRTRIIYRSCRLYRHVQRPCKMRDNIAR